MTNSSKPKEWDAKTVYEKQERCELVDVRNPDEFDGPLSHIIGAKLVTLGPELENHLKALAKTGCPKDIVFICRSGVRSLRATEYAMSLGLNNSYNMIGGMIAWNEYKLPTAQNQR